MPDLSPKVSIIIVHLDNQTALFDCLRSCQKISYPNYEIIIVTNGSNSQLTLALLQGFDEHVSMIVGSAENKGYARGNNLGIKEALAHDARYIVLLNDDTIVSPNFLDVLVHEAEKSHDIGMLGSKIYYADKPNTIWFSGAYLNRKTGTISTPRANQIDEGANGKPFESDYITGCALLIGAEVIRKIGMLDERFFLYWEDVDWGLRAKKAGFKNLVIPSAHIWHKISSSSGGVDSIIRVYHRTRSHLLMVKLHMPETLPKLYGKFIRDIAWLLLKSKDRDRIRKAQAYMAAIIDYHRGKSDRGPQWLWNN
jgi:GT2 family glycosyltransferase